jgi:hypothetical protein
MELRGERDRRVVYRGGGLSIYFKIIKKLSLSQNKYKFI